MKTSNILNNIAIGLLFMAPVSTFAQSEWTVTDAQKKVTNPIAFSDQSVNEGKTIYLANCKSCHGDPTKNNGLPLVPKPTDFGLQAFLDLNSDGSIFQKMTEGRATMPTYAAILTVDQRWNVVNYIRSFDANFTPSAGGAATTVIANSDEVTAPYFLEIAVDSANSQAVVTLFGTFNGQKAAVANAEVFVGIKRYFKNLPIMKAGETTNEMGQITVTYPTDLKSGEHGLGELVAYPVDIQRYGELTQSAPIHLKPVHIDDFNATRALWAHNNRVPVWLLITYLSIVIIVWGVMFKVVLNLLKIKKLGN